MLSMFMCVCVRVHMCVCVYVCAYVCVWGGYINSSQHQVAPDLWNCVKAEVAVLGSPSPISLIVSVVVKHQSLRWKLTLGEKSVAAPETRTRISIAPGFSVACSTNRAIPAPQYTMHFSGKKGEGIIWLQVSSTVVQEVTGGGVPDGFPPHLTDIPDINHLMKVNTVMPLEHGTWCVCVCVSVCVFAL